MAHYFPLLTDLEDQPVLIFGGGVRAAGKIEALLPCRPRITVAALSVSETVEDMARRGVIRLLRAAPSEAEALIARERPLLVILAEVAEEELPPLFALCRRAGLPVNTVDRKEYCTVLFPSVIRKGQLTVAVSTSGASPAAAKYLRERIEETLPCATDRILDWLAALRPRLRARDGIDRSRLSELYGELTRRAFAEDRPLRDGETEAILKAYLKSE